MKRLKALAGYLAISLGLASSPLVASTSVVSVPVVDNAWTFIGVPGFQTYGAASGTTQLAWGDAAIRIIDAAGPSYQVAGLEVPTWDGNSSVPVPTSGTLTNIDDGTTPRAAYLGKGVGSNIYATVGVMVLGQDITGSLSSDTQHLGAVIAALEYTGRNKNYDSPIRTMYIQSPDASAPDMKVLYQADYEGEEFLIQYETGSSTTLSESSNTTYRGTFNRAYTYENAADLGTDFEVVVADTTDAVAGNSVNGILHAYDQNLMDNDQNGSKDDIMPNTQYSAFNGNTYVTTDANFKRQALDGNLTVLGWDATAQQWRYFRAEGNGGTTTVKAASDFETLVQGQGYWVKADIDPTAVSINTPSGFVLGYDPVANIDHSSFIADGWNMLSFGDEYLAYSITGIVLDDYTALTDFNITDTYGATKLQLGDLSAITTEAIACATINKAIDGNSSKGFVDMNLRCLPSTAASGNIVLVSNRRFSIEMPAAVTPTNLDGSAMTAEATAATTVAYRSQYGAKAMLIEPNTSLFTETGVEGNVSVEFPAAGVDEEYVTIDDTMANIVGSFNTQMGTASGSTGANVNAIAIDMDFSGTTTAVLLASDYRFFVKDATLVRIFTYNPDVADTNGWTGSYPAVTAADSNNTGLRVVGGSNYSDVYIVDDNLTHTADQVNSVVATTFVNALKLESDNDYNTTMMIFYTGDKQEATARFSYVDLQEQGAGWDVLTETKCTSYSASIVNECNATTRGAIGSAWNLSTVVSTYKDANASGAFDGNYSGEFNAFTDNLGNTAFYAENFPIEGPLYDIKTTYGKKAELIITGKTEASSTVAGTSGSFISWKQIDVSKDPSEWYDNDDQYELFWTEKERGYWVYLNGEATTDIAFVAQANGTNFTINGTPYAHFNNYFAGTSSSALTRNHLDNFSLTLTASGLTEFGQATTNTDAFEVYAEINGYKTSFQRTGSSNDFTLSLDSHDTAGIGFDEGEITITVTLAEASGQTVSDTYLLDYQKPVITGVTQTASTLNLTVTGDMAEVHVYTGDINDSKYGTSQATNWGGLVTATSSPVAVNLGSLGIVFPNDFGSADYLDVSTYNTTALQLTAGVITDLRMTVKDNVGLYSDQEKRSYIPFYAGTGILSHSSSDANVYDSYPVVRDDTGTTVAAYDGTVDDGVQLKSATATQLTCAYYHNAASLSSQTVNARDIVLADGQTIGHIEYVDDYVGQPLICQLGSALYVGAFMDDGEINTNAGTAAAEDRIVVQQISGVNSTVAK